MTGLHTHEMTFLREYVSVLQPLAQSINLLQGEKKCYLGFLSPTILSLKSKLSDQFPHVTYTANILTAVIEALDDRFGAMLSSHETNFTCVGSLRKKKEDMCKIVIQ